MTKTFDVEQVTRLAQERSVRGSVVRLARQRADGAGSDQQDVIATALQLLLDKFQTIPDQRP